ncbi:MULTISPECIES: DUF1990 family protein [Mycetocola]|uniref:DUF1990 domain-containing protein n=1 Tax=Mycetocola lacteus TaxID=76637 RepID=A0A3L7ARE6_9MICO|nr:MULTISPECIES: DUF1990 family protein [Mycetocola]MCS4276033.1 uncharacterized protein (UPF0548 family) [Mycetocola sp. BIGb0189]RLP82211.1 DUF1990 domain-containing protein [Mycetocola lacteus]
MRRSNFEDQPVDYAAVGATQAADLMQYPPQGYVPAEDSIRLGSGRERYEAAASTLLSWGVQRDAGIDVHDVRPGSGNEYTGIQFDDEGNAVAPNRRHSEQRFAPDGSAFLDAGTTAKLRGKIGRYNLESKIRVVYLVENQNSTAFAYGTVSTAQMSGEESFMVELRDDDSVWFTVRSFMRPIGAKYRAFPPLGRARMTAIATAYMRALSPTWASPTT